MSRKRERIDVNPKQDGLNQAFSGLDMPNLPPPPEASPAQAAPEPAAAKSEATAKKKGRVVLRRETAHRGGKTVIVVHDFPTHLHPIEIEAIGKRLRAACGCGGAVKGRTVELQGDQPAKIREVLEAEGFEVAGVR
ncbi:MAG TPA: translation initiation factor [Chthoniobacteraceae bacterium]|jgi:translation initiation factor 1